MELTNVQYRSVKPAYAADFDEPAVWSKIIEDVRMAKYKIVIQATSRQCELILKHIQLLRECRNRGVDICVLVQPPETFRGLQLPPYGSFHTFVYSLREPGVHVSFKRDVRSLLLLVDDRCVWESLVVPDNSPVTQSMPGISRFSNIEVINQSVNRHNLNGCSDCIDIREKCFATGDPSLLLQALRVYRKKAALTQAEAADRSGFTQSWVSKVETGKGQGVTVDALSTLSSAYNVTPVFIPNFLIPSILKPIFEHLKKPLALQNTDE